jgi:mannose-6-phosphate isomerase-like protein (cupin superfamily)
MTPDDLKPMNLLPKVISLPTNDDPYFPVLTDSIAHKLHSGLVRLQPGDSSGLHSTKTYEEMIVVLSGAGELHYADQILPIKKGEVGYVPPETFHNMVNSGTEPLQYLYIVTPVYSL